MKTCQVQYIMETIHQVTEVEVIKKDLEENSIEYKNKCNINELLMFFDPADDRILRS